MPRTRTLALPAAVVAVLVAAAVAVVRWASRDAPRSVPVAGGTLSVAVVGGTNHYNPHAPLWSVLCARLPAGWTRRWPALNTARVAVASTNPVLLVWVACPTNFPPGRSGPGRQLGVRVSGDLGIGAGNGNSVLLTGLTRDGRAYEAHRIDVVPRRSPTFRVVVSDAPWGGKTVADFRMPNPLFDPDTPPFAGTPVPLEASDGDLVARLERFVVFTNPPAGTGMSEPRARLEFTFRQAGVPTTNWVAYHVLATTDATGNASDGNSWSHGWKDGRAFVEYSRFVLPPVEPWKVEVELCRRGGFAEGETTRFRGVKLQPKLDPSRARTNVLGGIPLAVLGLEPNQYDTRARRADEPVPVQLVVTALGVPQARRGNITVVRAVDDRGVDVTSNAWNGDDERREFQLSLSPGATSVDVDLAYEPSRRVRFAAQPGLEPARR